MKETLYLIGYIVIGALCFYGAYRCAIGCECPERQKARRHPGPFLTTLLVIVGFMFFIFAYDVIFKK